MSLPKYSRQKSWRLHLLLRFSKKHFRLLFVISHLHWIKYLLPLFNYLSSIFLSSLTSGFLWVTVCHSNPFDVRCRLCESVEISWNLQNHLQFYCRIWNVVTDSHTFISKIFIQRMDQNIKCIFLVLFFQIFDAFMWIIMFVHLDVKTTVNIEISLHKIDLWSFLIDRVDIICSCEDCLTSESL